MARRTPAGIVAAVTGLTLVLAACGGGSDTPGAQSPDTPSGAASATSAPGNAAEGAPGAPSGQPGGGGGAAGGPSGGTNADPVRWTGTFCKGLGESTRALITVLKSGSSGAKKEDRKAATLAYLNTVESSLGAARTGLQGLGRPAALSQQTHDELVAFLGTAVELIKKKRPEVAAVDVNAPDFERSSSPSPATTWTRRSCPRSWRRSRPPPAWRRPTARLPSASR